MTSSNKLRSSVVAIYRELLNLSKDWPGPGGEKYFRQRLHAAFSARQHLRDEETIRRAVERAEFVRREIEALYYLKRYRTLRRRYDVLPPTATAKPLSRS